MSTHLRLTTSILAPIEGSEAEWQAWQAEKAAREQAECAPQEAKEKRRAQRMRALLGPTGGIAPHIPVRPSRYRQEPSEIDKQLAGERRRRVTQRSASQHAPPAPAPAAKPWSAGEKARWKAEAGPRARPGGIRHPHRSGRAPPTARDHRAHADHEIAQPDAQASTKGFVAPATDDASK